VFKEAINNSKLIGFAVDLFLKKSTEGFKKEDSELKNEHSNTKKDEQTHVTYRIRKGT
jgi:hypothetical protein